MTRQMVKYAESMIAFFRSATGKDFTAAMAETYRDLCERLSTEKDPVAMYRLQGEIKAVKTFLKLDSELTQYMADVKSGKVQTNNNEVKGAK